MGQSQMTVRHEVARFERGKSLQASVHACPQSFSASTDFLIEDMVEVVGNSFLRAS